MARSRVLAIVMAGGQGNRMDVLTRERAKPSLPYAGVYQLIDFPLTNLHHSGVDDVWVVVQYQNQSIDEVVANGRPWDLDRTRGGLRILPPQEGIGANEDGFASGNADVLYRLRDFIRREDPSEVLVLSADHVYRFDYMDAIETHRAKEAGCTLVTYDRGIDEASNHATVESNRLGRVTGFAYKPDEPETGIVATEVFVYSPGVLVEALEELVRELAQAKAADDDSGEGSGSDGGGDPHGEQGDPGTPGASVDEGEITEEDDLKADSGLGDFGEHLLPRLVEQGVVYEHRMEGYWRDVGRPEAYLASHRDLVMADPGLFDDDRWPVLTRTPQGAPTRLRPSAKVDHALLGPHSDVSGTVRRSVLGPDVVVQAGAVVTDSVLGAGVVVRPGARVTCAIVDSGCEIGEDARVGGRAKDADKPTDDEIALLGRDSVVTKGAKVGKGARLEPGTVA